MSENFGLLDFVGTYGPPINLLYLVGALEKQGFNAGIIDLTHDQRSLAECADSIAASGAEIVGVAVHFTFLVPRALELLSLIKERQPSITIVAGGVHFTALPEKTMNECAHIDIGVIGEGEETIVDIVRCHKQGMQLDKVPGIIYRDGGRIVKTGRRALISNLNDLSFPDYSRIDLSLYYPAIHLARKARNFMITTSRGCPFQCTFCDRTVLGSEVRNFSSEYISRMIDHLIEKYNAECLLLEDENFCIRQDRFRDICDILREKFLKYNITWSCCLRADSVEPWMGKVMYDSGCRAAIFGIESGSQRMLDTYRKRLNVNILAEKCRIIRNAGIRLSGSFIVGGPGENEESVNETIRLVRKIELDYIFLWYFMPYPGSAIYKDIESAGEIMGDYSNHSGHRIAFVPRTMSRKQLELSYKKIYRAFYTRPSVVLRIIRQYGLSGLPEFFKNGFKYLWRFIVNK